MTTPATGIGRRPRHRRSYLSREWRLSLILIGVIPAVVGVVLVVENGTYRAFEASMQTLVVRGLGIGTVTALGSDVILRSHGAFYALTVAPACSAALLTAPFCFVTAALIAVGRVNPRRGFLALAGVGSFLFVVNQARILIIYLSIRLWGFTTGYGRGHILLGTALSTVGVMVALAAFVFILASGRRAKLRHG